MGLTLYNEHDPRKAAWLRELAREGHIAQGEVDERSVEDIPPDDLRGFRGVHLFAGVGIWSYALRLAGWSDERAVWTCSCPCQPFSSAGKGGGFGDERHLWPSAFHLIRECRPVVCFGEQVASDDGLAWLDLVQADLEAVGYTVGTLVTPAASYGAPHGRHRIYWVADSQEHGTSGNEQTGKPHAQRDGGTRDMADADGPKRRKNHRGQADGSGAGRQAAVGAHRGGGPLGLVADPDGGFAGDGQVQRGGQHGQQPQDGRAGVALGDTSSTGLPDSEPQNLLGTGRRIEGRAVAKSGSTPGPVNGFWADADWLHCRPEPDYPDGRWRPVEPGTFPLAHGATARVVKLRGYGDGIVATQAAAFIKAYCEEKGEVTRPQ